MELTISNDEELTKWMGKQRVAGRAITAIKGPPPEGATYEDGEPITRPVNVAWKCIETGEVCEVRYNAPLDLRERCYNSLADETCPACQQTKKRRQSFCARCYGKLPIATRRALYRTEGYPQTWDAALKSLTAPELATASGT